MVNELAEALAEHTGKSRAEVVEVMLGCAEGHSIPLEAVEQRLGLGDGFFKNIMNVA